MKISSINKEVISNIRTQVKARLSEKRYIHTLGVEKMAIYIGEKIMPEMVDHLSAAALLHDISKEYSEAEHLDVIKKHKILLTEDDYPIPALWHSITAPYVIMDEFNYAADSDILSAIANHTVGSPDMTIFDEIILLADYIEEGRKYTNCIDTRNTFLNLMEKAESIEEKIHALHFACFTSLENNLNEFASRGIQYHHRTMDTRNALLAKLER